MKKLVIMIATLLAINTASLANDVTFKDIELKDRYVMKATPERVANCLRLTDRQTYWTDLYWTNFKANMLKAYTEEDEKYVPYAVRNNLKCMKNILTKKQYEIYRKIMIATLINNNFIKEDEKIPENYIFLEKL